MSVSTPSAIDHAATVLRMFEIEPTPLDRLLDSFLKDHSEINSRQRRLIGRAVYGVARWRLRLVGCLAIAGIKNPDHRTVAETYLRWKPCEDFDLLRNTLGLTQRLEGLDVDAIGREGFPGGDAAYFSYPEFIFDVFAREYGEAGARELAFVLNEPLGPTLRVNALKATRDEAMRMLEDEGVHSRLTGRSPYGLRFPMRTNFRELDSFRNGIVEVQDEASQLAAMLASPEPGEVVLDACAGAGGKSIMLAMLMQDKGEILAHDADVRRLSELKKRVKRSSARSIKTESEAGLKKRGQGFDLVLIDAPCSGTGTLRRSPDLKWRINPSTISESARAQRDIINKYSRFVKPKGRLVYATCSLLRQENEEVVADFLKRGEFKKVDANIVFEKMGVDCKGIVTSDGYLKTDPRAGDWDGFFAVLMTRG